MSTADDVLPKTLGDGVGCRGARSVPRHFLNARGGVFSLGDGGRGRAQDEEGRVGRFRVGSATEARISVIASIKNGIQNFMI